MDTKTVYRTMRALSSGEVGRQIEASSYGEAVYYLRRGEILIAIAKYPTHRVLLYADTPERYRQLEYKNTPYILYAAREEEIKQFLLLVSSLHGCASMLTSRKRRKRTLKKQPVCRTIELHDQAL